MKILIMNLLHLKKKDIPSQILWGIKHLFFLMWKLRSSNLEGLNDCTELYRLDLISCDKQ